MNNPRSKRTINKALVKRLSLFMNKDMTQYELSILSDIPYPTIKSIFQGKTEDIKLSTIIKLAQALNITPSLLIDDKSFLANNLDI